MLEKDTIPGYAVSLERDKANIALFFTCPTNADADTFQAMVQSQMEQGYVKIYLTTNAPTH